MKNQTNIKVYIVLRNEGDQDYKKIILMIGANQAIFELKRKIEKEFSELFPQEPPFVVAKLEDQSGFALSNGSQIQDVLKYDDTVIAQPEKEGVVHGGNHFQEHVMLLKNLQSALLNKIAMSSNFTATSQEVFTLFQTVVPVGLTYNQPETLKNVAIVMSKALTYQNVQQLFREDQNDYQVAQDSLALLEMIILLFEHWASSYLKTDKYLKGLVIGVLEVMVHSIAFWARLKQSTVITSLLMRVQDFDDTIIRDKAVKIMTALNRERHLDIPKPMDPNRYERRQQVVDDGQFQKLQVSSQLLPAYDLNQDHIIESQMITPTNSSQVNYARIGGSRGEQRSQNPGVQNFRQHVGPNQISEICRLVSAQQTIDTVSFGFSQIIPLIESGKYDWELGKASNLLDLISVIEHQFEGELVRQQFQVVNEVVRQITSEQKALMLLQRYGISKILLAIKKHKQYDTDMCQIVEELATKLIKSAQNLLPVNILYMLATSAEVTHLHPKLQAQAWSSLVYLSESDRREEQKQNQHDFENFLPKFAALVSKPMLNTSLSTLQYKLEALTTLANLSLREYLRPVIIANDGIKTFIDILQGDNQDFVDNVQAQRVAAKGLVNLALTKREVRQNVISQLSNFMEQIVSGKCDRVVAGYLSALVKGQN